MFIRFFWNLSVGGYHQRGGTNMHGGQITKTENHVYIANTSNFSIAIFIKIKLPIIYRLNRIISNEFSYLCVTALRDKIWLAIIRKPNKTSKFSYNDINKISNKQFGEVNSLDFSFLMRKLASNVNTALVVDSWDIYSVWNTFQQYFVTIFQTRSTNP